MEVSVRNTVPSFFSSNACAPATAADWGSTTLTLRSAADAAARATRSNNEAQSARITILLFTRKGLRWTVYAGLLALRVRMHEQRLATGRWQFARASGFYSRPSRDCSQWTAAVFSLTVARQRGNCTRFPVFAIGQRRANRKVFQRTEIVVREIYWAERWKSTARCTIPTA